MSTRKSKPKTNESILLKAKENHKFIIDLLSNKHFLPFLNITLCTVFIGVIASICIYNGQLSGVAILISEILVKMFAGRK